MISSINFAAVVLSALISSVFGAATCPAIQPAHPVSVASGYTFQTVANSLAGARGIIFDSAGHLLVLQKGVGVVSLTLKDGGGACVTLSSSKTILANKDLNHGIALSNDGKTLYASTAEAVLSWSYNPTTMAVGSTSTSLITGMTSTDHVTRTLFMSSKKPGTMLVSRGSNDNVDLGAANVSSGRSMIRAFDLNSLGAGKTYTYTTSGTLIGYGLRNSVGVTEHPLSGGLYSVENSMDNIVREGKDVHLNNPGEEMNFHGYLNGAASDYQGANFGYPNCLAAWAPSELPDNKNLTVGSQFVLSPTTKINDDWCKANTKSPVITFAAHQAPLDIKFTADGLTAYVTFHGSWNRQPPIGYKLVSIPFTSAGQPVPKPDSTTATTDIIWNPSTTVCPGSCFRPVGLAIDGKGRLFVSSDATGEIFVVVKGNDNSSSDSNGNGSGATTTATGDSTSSSPSSTSVASASPTKSAGSHSKLTSPWSFLLMSWFAFILTVSLCAFRLIG